MLMTTWVQYTAPRGQKHKLEPREVQGLGFSAEDTGRLRFRRGGDSFLGWVHDERPPDARERFIVIILLLLLALLLYFLALAFIHSFVWFHSVFIVFGCYNCCLLLLRSSSSSYDSYTYFYDADDDDDDDDDDDYDH